MVNISSFADHIFDITNFRCCSVKGAVLKSAELCADKILLVKVSGKWAIVC